MKKITVKEVAKEAGVSTATISRVLNNSGYVSKHAREQVLSTVQRLNYQPNSIARSLKQDKSRSIGIVLPDMTNPYFMKISRQVQRRCVSEGYHLLFMDTEEDPAKEKEALDFLMEMRVEAIILAGTGGNRERIKSIQTSGIHVVLIDRRIEGLKLDVVAEDNRTVSEEAVAILLNKGHRNIGIINGPLTIVTAKERFEGSAAALRSKGMSVDDRYIFQGDYTRDSGRAAIQYLMNLSPTPTAVFSANNEMTFGLYLGLHALGIDAEDLEVISFGDLEFSPLFKHKLSVIKQNPLGIGEAAVDVVLKRLDKGSTEFENRLFFPHILLKH